MRILLTAINAKYIHSNLAVYSLKASAGKYEPQVELAEYTINHQADEIFAGIYRRKPDILLFSCYIWNRREVTEAAASIKKVLPETIVWAGGPEVSYDAPQFLREHPQFDGVMVGEGEATFYRLLNYYIDGAEEFHAIPGIVWRAAAAGNGTAQETAALGNSTAQETAASGNDTAQETEMPGNDTAQETEMPGNDTAQETEMPGNETAQETAVPRDQIYVNPPAVPCVSLDGLPFVYRDLSQFENRIIYYESSRGCPFSCSYCLSSVDKRVRYRSLELVKRELGYFLEKRVKQVKFVDRTFNCSHERTLALWRFLKEHDNGVTNFHCEISADLLNEEELSELADMRPGLLQLEIGVQTVNKDALSAIHRTARFEKIAANVNRIAESHNIHQHLDLIAGLPYEDMESFRTSFDAVYRLHPQELQLGFLKVLKGSEIHERAKEYGIRYRDTPPYEVLATDWITCDELLRLKEVEEMLEIYYNSQQFRNTIRAAEELFARPIELYEALADYYKKENLAGKSHSRMQRFEILRTFLKERGARMEMMQEALILDLYLRENAKSRPAWAFNLAEIKEQAISFYQREERMHTYLPERSGMSWKQTMRMTHLERFSLPEICEGAGAGQKEQRERWVLFDYEHRDPLTGDARTIDVRIEDGE